MRRSVPLFKYVISGFHMLFATPVLPFIWLISCSVLIHRRDEGFFPLHFETSVSVQATENCYSCVMENIPVQWVICQIAKMWEAAAVWMLQLLFSPSELNSVLLLWGNSCRMNGCISSLIFFFTWYLFFSGICLITSAILWRTFNSMELWFSRNNV